jgi:hypothetical protein
MIPMYLLSIAIDKLLDVRLDEADLGQDLVSGGGPDKRCGTSVPVCDVVLYSICLINASTLLKVPRRMDWRVMMPKYVSI